MKTLVHASRPLLLALLVALSFTACKKEVDPAPSADLGTRVAGQYTFSELSFNGKTLPASQTNLKGSIQVIRQTANTATLQLDIRSKADNDEFLVGSVEGLDLADAGNGEVALRADGQQIGTAKNNQVTIKGTDDNGTAFTLTATK